MVGPPDEEVYRTPGREFAKHDGKGEEENLQEVRRKAGERGRRAVETARERGRSFLGGRQQSAAEEIGKYGDALRAAAQRLREERAVFAGATDAAAGQLDKASRYMKDHSPEDIVRSVNDYARRHPGAVWGSMLFAGFALSRLLSAPEQPRE